MKWIKQAIALSVLALPAAAFAGGSQTGTITHFYINAVLGGGQFVYIEMSGTKTGNPACSTNSPYQFMLPILGNADGTLQFYTDLLTELRAARKKGNTVTVTGSGLCDLADNTETIATVTIDY